MDQKVECLSLYLENLNLSQEEELPQNAKGISSFCDLLKANHHSLGCQRVNATWMPNFEHNQQGVNNENGSLVEIQYSKSSGRYLAATRDIMAGETLYKETPLVVAPKGGSGPTCLNCFLLLPAFNWPICDTCSAPKCGSCNGNYHSNAECKILSKILSNNSGKIRDSQYIKLINIILTPLRTWIITDKNPQFKNVVDALQSNASLRKGMAIGKFIDDFIVNFFKNETELDLSPEYIHKVCGVFDTNAFEIIKDDRQSRALLPASSLMNHSCIPNTQHWFVDNQCVVRASVFIKKGDAVTNSYTHTLCGTATRDKHLMLTKQFICNCLRCSDPTEMGTHLSSIICPKCNDEGLLVPPLNPTSKWACNECQYEVAPKIIGNILKASGQVVSQASDMNISSLQKAIDKLEHLLGKQHYMSVELQFLFVRTIAKFNLEASTEELQQALNIILFLKSIVSKIEPGITRIRGVLLSDQLILLLALLTRDRKLLGTSHQAVISSTLENIESVYQECEVILKYDYILEKVQQTILELETLLKRKSAATRR